MQSVCSSRARARARAQSGGGRLQHALPARRGRARLGKGVSNMETFDDTQSWLRDSSRALGSDRERALEGACRGHFGGFQNLTLPHRKTAETLEGRLSGYALESLAQRNETREYSRETVVGSQASRDVLGPGPGVRLVCVSLFCEKRARLPQKL